MSKKIYDIVPPIEEENAKEKVPIVFREKKLKTVKPVLLEKKYVEKTLEFNEEKTNQDISENNDSNQEMPKEIIPKPVFAEDVEDINIHEFSSRKKHSLTKIFSLAGVGVLVLIVGYFYFSLQKVNVEIWPNIETLSFKEGITADASIQIVDEEKNIIPGKLFSEQKSLTENFSSTGKTSSSTKAEGNIKVYNKFTPATPLSLKAGTHFLSDAGKYYISIDKITIPAGKTVSGKFVPGSIDVKVVAEDVGDTYNTKSAKFSVPKLVGTTYYYSIYAEPSGAILGGSTGQANQVTFEDIQKSKETITTKITQEIEASLKAKIPADYVVIDSEIKKNITATTNAKSGSVADNFEYLAKAEASVLAFKKTDVEKYAKDYILGKMADQKVFLENSLVINYVAKQIDLNAGKMVFDLDFSGKTYQQVDKNDLISLFREKNQKEIQDVITRNLGESVFKTKINFSPFWTMRAPSDKSKITLDLKF